MFDSRFFTVLGTLALLTIVALTIRMGLATAAVIAVNERAEAAYAGRLTRLAENYGHVEPPRAGGAGAARWTDMVQLYPRQRAEQAEAARWTGMAQQLYARQRAEQAEAARWEGLAAFLQK